MTETYFPFDSGAGGTVLEAQWRAMARLWLRTGVISGELSMLECFADSTGMRVKVPAGQAWIEGHFYQSDAEEVMPIDPANLSNPRIDRVVLEADFVSNVIGLTVLPGTPGASPSPPALTQTADVLWQIPIAQVLVGTGVITIDPGNVTDERKLVQPGSGECFMVKDGDQTLTNDTFVDVDGMYFEAEADETWIVEGALFFSGATGADLQWKFVMPGDADGAMTTLEYITAAAGTSDTKFVGQDADGTFTSGALGAAPRRDPIWVRGVIKMGATAGRVKLQAAQAVDTGATTIDDLTYLIARRVA